MPIDAVKIPQNVQIEDRIVGPLTLRQIIIMAIGGGFSYMLYAMVQKSVGQMSIMLTIVLWIPAVISAAFALVRINDLSLMRICFLLLERIQKPAQRTWAPRTGISITIRTSTAPKEDEKKTVPQNSQMTAEKQIAELSNVIDRIAPTAPQPVDTVQEVPATPKAAVDPSRIQVDHPATTANPEVSDLSVFRDIFPSTNKWQA